MAFQLGMVTGIGAFLGMKMDKYFSTERPYFTALFTLLFLIIAFYLVLKELLFIKKS